MLEGFVGDYVKSVSLAFDASTALTMLHNYHYDFVFIDGDLGRGENGLDILDHMSVSAMPRIEETMFIANSGDPSTNKIMVEHYGAMLLGKPWTAKSLNNIMKILGVKQ